MFLRRLDYSILLALICLLEPAYAVEFNMDILDAADRENIDLSRFSEAGYIMPGTYSLNLKLNEKAITDQEIVFIEEHDDKNDKPSVKACLTKEQVNMLGMKKEALEKIIFDDEGLCADFSALEGIVIRGDLSDSTLLISIPQAWLEYQDSTWLPPSRWENGIPGMMLDYNVNTLINRSQSGSQTESASASGTVGANYEAWRLRGDWQGNHSNSNNRQNSFDWSRIYAYRALPQMMAKLVIGENYLSSDIFDSWRFTGFSLMSDETQLPPKLRGYSPEVTGIARTNAKVTISQLGRVIYETTVAAGPFRIQDLNSAINGQLDVKVEEQDGAIQTFQVTTASVPYLTRPGQMRYKIASGRPSNYNHNAEGPLFGSGEVSWGIANSWSLYGGGIFSEEYNSLAIGLARDLYKFGALSADVTQAVTRIPGEKQLTGRSYRMSYSKRFDEYNGDITFAGYRFSERNYLSMSEYLALRDHAGYRGNSKELYTVTANKSFSDFRLTTNLNWTHQTYWDQPDADSYTFSTSRYFDIGEWQNISATLSVGRSDYNGRKDDTAWLSLSMPLAKGTVSYNGNWNGNGNYSQTSSWFQRLDSGDSYRVTAGNRTGANSGNTTQASGFYTHNGDMSNLNANVSWVQNGYTSAGLSFSGGVTATPKGAAIHGGSSRGGTRMLVSTDGISDVPINSFARTNYFGIAVEASVPSYYRTSTSIDVTRLPDDIETASSPVAEAALTEGAIGYRRFDVLKGAKVVAIVTQIDGSHPPFGASIRNQNERELGIVSDQGLAWISGVSADEKLKVFWAGKAQCEISLPKIIPAQQLLLPCSKETNG